MKRLRASEPGGALNRRRGDGVGDLLGLVGQSGGPVGVGRATAKSMVANIIGIHAIGMLGTQIFWGSNPRAPIGG